MTKLDRLLVAGVLGIVAIAGVALSARADSGYDWHLKTTIISITTDQKGVIDVIKYQANSAAKQQEMVRGCGATLEALPHLMDNYRQGKPVDIGEDHDCLRAVRVTR